MEAAREASAPTVPTAARGGDLAAVAQVLAERSASTGQLRRSVSTGQLPPRSRYSFSDYDGEAAAGQSQPPLRKQTGNITVRTGPGRIIARGGY